MKTAATGPATVASLSETGADTSLLWAAGAAVAVGTGALTLSGYRRRAQI